MEQNLDTDGGDEVQYQQRRSDRPERRRALIKGEMINEFHNALSAAEWHEYYNKIIDRKYDPDIFEDNDLATVTIGDKILTVKMLPNGEFSVTNVWKHRLTVSAIDVIKELKNDYATYSYTDEEIESWVTRLVSYDGEKLFFPYDRHSGQFLGYAQQSAAGSENDAGVSGKAGSDGETVLEILAGQSDGGNTAQNQQRTHTLTDLEVLEMAEAELELAKLEAGEREALGILKKHLVDLKKIQDERAAQGRLYRQQQFGTKVDRAEAEKTLNRMKVLDGQIQRAKAEVLSIENKEVLSKVLQKARKVVETKQWEKDQESLKRWRDRRNNADAIRKYRTRLKNDVDELTNWVLHPNNKDVVKHIPEVLKDSVIRSSVALTLPANSSYGVAMRYSISRETIHMR